MVQNDALERTAAAGVEARIVPRDPGHDRARQDGNRRRRHVRHVAEVIVDRLRRAAVDIAQKIGEAPLALPGVEDDPERLRFLEVRRQFGQHGDASRDMEAADSDRHAALAKFAPDVERARKLIRLHADQRHHPLIGEDSLRNGGNVDDGVALVVDFHGDFDVGAENVTLRAFGEQAIDAGEAVRGDGRAPPLDHIAVAVVMRRLDQSDCELSPGHSIPVRGFTDSPFRRLSQLAPWRGGGNSKSASRPGRPRPWGGVAI